MDEAKANTPDLRLISMQHQYICICNNDTYFHSERLGVERAKVFTPPVKRSSRACPFADCSTVTNRLADHLVWKHNLKGAEWKPLRHKLLGISKSEEDDLYEEDVDMLGKLVGKVEDFKGDSISLEYLRPDCEQLVEEMMFPVPEWAQGECLRKRVNTQTYEEGEIVFEGALPNLDSLMTTMKKRSGRKRKRD